jgi:hypothetical protein
MEGKSNGGPNGQTEKMQGKSDQFSHLLKQLDIWSIFWVFAGHFRGSTWIYHPKPSHVEGSA